MACEQLPHRPVHDGVDDDDDDDEDDCGDGHGCHGDDRQM